MKTKIVLLSSLAMVAMLLSSCGINSALQVNQNATVTNVTLSNANYRVLNTVKGQASQPYILCIGAMSKTSLYANAKADLMKNADLKGGARALVNIIAEEHAGGVPPFYILRTITYSADVIEFTK